ncbi:MAG: HAD family phosphatase [Puniceicoccaceae bacterium]|nr:MAG: HAD family phosphatase [Puniceicoccaceae bacterium]
MIGALFDWDGVVLDSSRQHELSWERLAAEEGRTLPAGHFKAGFGRKNEFIIPELLGWTREHAEVRRLSLRKEELYREIVAEQGIEPLPGVKVFLERLRAAGVPCAVGSSTQRKNIETVLGVMGLADYFPHLVTSEDVGKGKPDPEVFLKAAAAVGRPPERCVVFEDAYFGLEAARAGGMKAVAVATTHAREELAGRADRIVDRLDELEVEDLLRLVGG